MSQPNTGRGIAAFGDVARAVAEKVGGSLLNGAFKRHTGIEDVDVAGAIGMAGETLAPVVQDAYAAAPDESVLDTLQRRVVWSFGLVGALVLTVGSGYLIWTWIKKSEYEEGED